MYNVSPGLLYYGDLDSSDGEETDRQETGKKT